MFLECFQSFPFVRCLWRFVAAGDEEVTHLHVHDRTLCEEDGRVPIRSALRQGRLCDFFLLVQQVLQTDNAGSAFVRLEDWDSKSCANYGLRLSLCPQRIPM